MVTHFPSTAISCTEAAPCNVQLSRIGASDSENRYSDSATPVLRNVHVSAQLVEVFHEIASENTKKDLETCGVLGAFLKEKILYATTLIVPKQESTSSSVMVPEAVAIVVAPTDKTRSYGLFRLTDPNGMSVLGGCEKKGFHPHPDSADGRPLYEQCSHVYVNPNLRFEIFDLR
ncbi:hypothetical protein KSS87_003680 [Heliosperma pusillum]|nr:hypothetical protein KSS87_017344 [Heliosperma pusillum]KAH9614113.1 hypothetical protein KSS87_003680 [Heliosperma pusillum]